MQNAKITIFIPFSILFLLFTSSVYATGDVVINEFLPNPSGPSNEDTEWIELYNASPSTVDLSGWKLDDIDNGGSSPYVIASGMSIPASGFLYFEKSQTNVGLNNTGDTVRLIDSSGSVVDNYSYSSTTEDVSIGRTSDGGGLFVTCQSSTKNATNVCSEPTPTPTSAPIPSLTPTVATHPTLNPTLTPKATTKINPTITSAPTKITSTQAKENPPTAGKILSGVTALPGIGEVSSNDGEISASADKILGIDDRQKSKSFSQQVVTGILITSAVICFIISIFISIRIVKRRDKRENPL